MRNQSSKKSWIIIGIIIVTAILAYYMFFAGSGTPAAGGLLEAQPEGNLVGAEVLSLLNQIQSLKIDTAFFQSSAYRSLVDYTVAIPDQSVGRANPFAPIPGFIIVPKTTGATGR